MVRKSLVLLAVLALAGCGYRAGYTMRRDVHSIAIPVFANDSFYRNVELDLTREVISTVEKRTGYRIVDSSAADAVLEGRIRDYRTTVLQEDAHDNPTAIALVISVRVTLRSVRDGKVLYTGDIRDNEDFSPVLGTTEAQTSAVLMRRIAARIVEYSLEQDW